MTESITDTPGSEPMSPIAWRRWERRRRDIAFHARRLFLERGDTEVTVELICERAGVSARTFHRHFRVKADVVVPLFTSWYDELSRRLDVLADEVDVLTALARLLAQTNLERPQTHRFLRIISADPEYRLRWMSVDEPFANEIEQRLTERGLVPAGAEARLAAALIVQATRVAYETWLNGEDDQAELEPMMREAMATATAAWPQLRVHARIPTPTQT